MKTKIDIEEFIDVLGEYKLSKLRITKHGYEGKTNQGWIPISETIYDEATYAGVPDFTK